MKKLKIKRLKKLARHLDNPVINYAFTALGFFVSYEIAAHLSARFPRLRTLLEEAHDEIIDQVQHSKERIQSA